MFHIFNSSNVKIIGADGAVNEDDLASRGEWCYEFDGEIAIGDSIDPVTFEVTPYQKTLDEEKASATSAINEYRNAKINDGVSFNGWNFDSDEKARLNILGGVSLAQMAIAQGSTELFQWGDADNQIRQLTPQQVIDLGVLVGQHVSNNTIAARNFKNRVNEATGKSSVGTVLAEAKAYFGA